MTSTEIEVALYDYFNFLQNDVITNIFVNNYECDMIVIRKSLYAIEVEIKVSVSDLILERKKSRYRYNQHSYKNGDDGYHDSHFGMSDMFKEKWFAMPKKMQEEGLKLIPKYAGLLVIDDLGIVEVAKTAQHLKSKPISQSQRMNFLRLGVQKCFNLKQRIVNYSNEKNK